MGCVSLAAALSLLPCACSAASETFPEPAALRVEVDFWTRVYVEVSTDGGLIHDARNLGVVYEVVAFKGAKSLRVRQKTIDKRKRYWRAALKRMAAGKPPRGAAETAVAQALRKALARTPTGNDFKRAAGRLRFQLGQRDKFRAGLVRAGAYEDQIRKIFRQHGLPTDLAYLPHVESSFQPRARSKYGAAGMWQFMRATGRRYLSIDYVVDERLDPERASVGAARLLRDNYAKLGTWPLAITAYNHGATGMRRAVKKLGTRDIATIVSRYDGRAFGFASRNFYVQFLAARRVARDSEAHFGGFARAAPKAVDTLVLPFYVDAKMFNEHLGVDAKVIAGLNPALRRPVWRSDKWVPKGYELRLPVGTVQPSKEQWLAAIPARHRHAEQRRSQVHTVSRGETLSAIAKLQGTSVATIVSLNGLANAHRIYPGQKLELITGSKQVAAAKPAKARAASVPTTPEAQVVAAVRAVDGLPPPRPRDSRWRRIDGDTVIVDGGETLGHFADWLGIPTRQLRAVNRISSSRPIRMGQILKLDFSKVSQQRFLERRIAHHHTLDQNFLGLYRVTGTVDHTVKRGDNLWVLSHKVYSVPPWLVHRYNPQADLTRLTPGTRFTIPVVEPLSSS